jgi:apolipoprotein D and lipocalin family protein
MKSSFIFTALCFAAFNAQAADDAAVIDKAEPVPVQALSPVVALDVPRYMGLWYEIAKYPNWFQRNCVAATRAEYSLQDDGRVQVANRCQMASGETNQAMGVARQVGAASSAMLEVRFAPAWLSFIPAVWGDYWVIDIDDAYQLVAVSEPERKYLWVLSRTPTINSKTYADLLTRLASKGFDVSKLDLTRQDGAPQSK